ncbi:MAG: ATP-binding protein, partial [Solirubrobacterales bacterium]
MAPTGRGGRIGVRGEPTELLEREDELRLIDEAIARAREGSGGTIAIQGPPGIGKTALLRAAHRHAEDAGLLCLSAAGRDLEEEFAFGVARQLFEPPLRALEPAQRERVLSGAAAPAASLLGAAPETVPPPDIGFALAHALYWLSANLADLRPLLLEVDDLQWADVPSRQTLAYLVPRLEGHPILLAAAVRTGGPGRVELDSLLPKDARAEILRPAPLSAAAVGRVVRAAVDPEASDDFCEACHRATGGNPFLARELALAAADEGITGEAADTDTLASIAPESVSRSALVRIRRLGAAPRALVQALAVLERAELQLTAALAGLDDQDAIEATEALTEADILAAELPLRFAHPILRSAVYEDLSPGARERAHREAAERLANAGGDAGAVASHLERSEPRGEDWAVEALHGAAREALARGSPEAAARALRRALAERADCDRAALLHELGRSEAAFGDPGAAERLAAAHETASDPNRRAEVLATLAETRFMAGQLETAVEGFREALDEVGSSPGSPLEVQLFLGYVMLARAYAPSAQDANERIRRRADVSVDDGRLAETARLATLAYDGFLRGQSADAVREAASLALEDETLLDGGGPGVQTFYLTTWALAGADGFEPAEAALSRAFDSAARSGSFLALGMACHHRLWSRWRRGQIPDALADCEIALELAERGWHLIRPAAGWARAECLIEAGDLPAAEEAVEQIEQLDPGLRGSCVEGWPLMGRSRLELERGNPEPALESALRCGAILIGLQADNPALAEWRSRAALAAAALGDGSRARELWEEELGLARAFGAPRAVGIALRNGGVVEGGQRGIALLREAVETLETSPARLERARALTDLGAALRRDRQPAEAREPLRRG